MTEKGAFPKRSKSTKKREGKAMSLLCLTPEGKHLEDLMWEETDFRPYVNRPCHKDSHESFCYVVFSCGSLLRLDVLYCPVFVRQLYSSTVF